MTALESFQDRLGHRFEDVALLEVALTHRSWVSEHPGEDNERMEFLGDAVLSLSVTSHLYARYPDVPEGDLAKARAASVSREALAEVADGLGLGRLIRLGRGEEASGGSEKESILADAMEAVLGAVFLDAGYDVAGAVTLGLFAEIADEMAVDPGSRDFKTRLQERLAADGLVPEYEIAGEGPDHARRFTARLSVKGRELGLGTGSSKKEAEQRAARAALQTLD
jgi:ribonuclease-3